jgi:hypothetical protein
MAPTLNAWLIHGALAAKAVAKGDIEDAERKKRDDINPHIHYADNDAYGFLLARYTKEKLEVEFVTIPEPIRKFGNDGPEAIRKVIYSVDRWKSGEKPELNLVKVEGEEPVMGIRT